MPLHAQPVIERLKRKLRVFTDLQFDNDQPAAFGYSEQVYESPLLAAIGRHLCINEPLIERRIDGGNVAADRRFQPALGLLSVDRIVKRRALHCSPARDLAGQPGEIIPARRVESPLSLGEPEVESFPAERGACELQ